VRDVAIPALSTVTPRGALCRRVFVRSTSRPNRNPVGRKAPPSNYNFTSY
jgi:hypothetical protein